MRELLADPGVLAIVKQVINVAEPQPQDRVDACSTEKPRLQGAVLRRAYECVQGMDDPFTKRDLADKMRAAGYTVKGSPKTALHYAMQKFVSERLLRLVEESGGGGRHESKYQRNGSNRCASELRDQSILDLAPMAGVASCPI